MKLVHKSLTACAYAACALSIIAPRLTAQNPDLPSPSAAAGFRPAQPNLTQVFLQIAASLEESGSPEGYIRHMQNEHVRISKKFAAATGQSHTSRMPAHMTPEYLDRLISNWKVLSPKLGLEALAVEAGRSSRMAIRGIDGNGTVVIKIFNEHQDLVVDTMEGGISKGADFEHLQSWLEAELGLLQPTEATKVISAQQEQYFALLARNEKALSAAERLDYITFLRRPRFVKADFANLDSFYKGPHDRLSKQGKEEMRQRVWAGTRPAEERDIKADAISAAKEFLNMKDTLFGKIDAALPPEKADKFKAAIDGVFLDLGELAQSELEIAILDRSLGK